MRNQIFNKKCKLFLGFSFIDVIVGISLIVVSFLGIFGLFQLATKVVWQSKAKITATALANKKIETARSLPYGSVGITGGFPDGALEQTTTTIVNDIKYTIETDVDYISDPTDGLTSSTDECIFDYKKVEIKISWQGKFPGEIIFTTDIMPKTLFQECETTGGILSVSVFDAFGIMIPYPLIEIKNPENDAIIESANPDDGEHNFSLATSTYKVVVSKGGFSTERTYGMDEITTPEKPHPLVIENELTPISFSIDQTSSFSVETSSPWGKNSFTDSFVDTSKISESNNINVEGGKVTLAKNNGVYFDEGATDNNICSFPGNNGDCGQSFTMGPSSKQVSKIQLYLRKATTTPSNIYLEIRSSSTTGPIIESSTMIDGSTLPANFEWIDFTLLAPVNLTAFSQYFLRLRSDPDSVAGLGQGPIHWGYLYGTSSPPNYSEGKAFRYIGVFQEELADYDFSFKIYDDEYISPGYLISTAINPAGLINWDEFSWTDSEYINTDIKYQAYYASGSDWYLIPESDLSGNTAGFDVSPQTLAGLSTTTYPQLKIRANLSTDDDGFSPTIFDWELSWINDTATEIGDVTFLLEGAKIIGKDQNEDPVYKYSTTSITNAFGNINITDLEWDNYTFSIDPGSGYNLIDTDPSPQPINLPPATNPESVTLYLKGDNSLLVTVRNEVTLEPVLAAAVRLQNAGLNYDETQYTSSKGQTYFIPLEIATYDLEVSAAGYLNSSTTVAVSGNTTKTVKIEQVE